MGWITLTLRKENIGISVNNFEYEDISLSRDLRAVSRNTLSETTNEQNNQEAEIAAAREEYDKLIANRPSMRDQYTQRQVDNDGNVTHTVGNDATRAAYKDANGRTYDTYEDAYDAWKDEYDIAKSNFEDKEYEIENKYDDIFQEIEENSTSKENSLSEEQTKIESEIESLNAELEAIDKRIDTDVKNSAVSFK